MSFRVSEYNREQWISLNALHKALRELSTFELQALKEASKPYLYFREELDRFQSEAFGPICRKVCFDTKLSACCGFESIFTFFADQVINCLCSTRQEIDKLLCLLEKPNLTSRCVYLGETGCLWQVRPISCAMFLCDDVKKKVFMNNPDLEGTWVQFSSNEKEFTMPVKPVLFDELERQFMRFGLDSPLMYYHRSPSLLRVKKKAGLI
jgi:hypothetical protein